MHRTSFCFLMLFLQATPIAAQTAPADSAITQAMLTEIRQLRQDLQTTAGTIQRVQIVMYRLQVEGAALDRATQRLEQARNGCSQAERQRKMVAAQIEQAEARKRNSHNPHQAAAEEAASWLKSSAEMWAAKEQQCQTERGDAET